MIPLNANLAQLKFSGIRRYTAMAGEDPECIRLTIGEPEFDTPAEIRAAAAAALARGETHYAPNAGLPALRREIAAFETGRGFPIREDQVLVTAGATEALFTAIFGVLDPGDEIIIPTPAFPLYGSIAQIAGATPVFLPTEKDGFQLTEEALRRAAGRTRAVVLNSPNNPTGVVYTERSLAAVKAVFGGKPVALICDHVYDRLCSRPCKDLTLDEDLREQVILCQSFSKPYAMTGWRAGYLAAPEAVASRLLLLHAALVTTVPTFVQTACRTALTVDIAPMAEAYARRRAILRDRLAEMGLDFPRPEGAFYAFPDISRFGLSSDEFCTRMIREAKVAAIPGSAFGTEGYLRLSCCCGEEKLLEGLARMERFLRTLG